MFLYLFLSFLSLFRFFCFLFFLFPKYIFLFSSLLLSFPFFSFRASDRPLGMHSGFGPAPGDAQHLPADPWRSTAASTAASDRPVGMHNSFGPTPGDAQRGFGPTSGDAQRLRTDPWGCTAASTRPLEMHSGFGPTSVDAHRGLRTDPEDAPRSLGVATAPLRARAVREPHDNRRRPPLRAPALFTRSRVGTIPPRCPRHGREKMHVHPQHPRLHKRVRPAALAGCCHWRGSPAAATGRPAPGPASFMVNKPRSGDQLGN